MLQKSRDYEYRGEKHHAHPTTVFHQPYRDTRTERSTEVIAQHINGVHTALGLRRERKNSHLVGHLGGEYAQIYQHDTHHQSRQGIRRQAQHNEPGKDGEQGKTD